LLPAWLDVDQMLYPDCHCVHYVLYPACLCINSILFIALSIVDCFHLVAMSMMYRNCICVNDAWYLDWCQWCMVSRLSLCPWCIVPDKNRSLKIKKHTNIPYEWISVLIVLQKFRYNKSFTKGTSWIQS
jgi:hypothetical protein